MSQDALDKEKSVRPGDGPSDVAPMGAGEEAGSGDEGDAVDRIVAQWRRERPDLDPSAKEITGRLVRLADLVQLRFRDAFADLGMSEGDYGLLAPLRRAGAPYELTPTALARARMMTSGGLTPALDRLEKRGWIEPAMLHGWSKLQPSAQKSVEDALHIVKSTDINVLSDPMRAGIDVFAEPDNKDTDALAEAAGMFSDVASGGDTYPMHSIQPVATAATGIDAFDI